MEASPEDIFLTRQELVDRYGLPEKTHRAVGDERNRMTDYSESVLTHDDAHDLSPAGRSLLTIQEAAAALRISRSSVYRLFDSGQLAWVQIGASRRVSATEIERFIAAHTQVAS